MIKKSDVDNNVNEEYGQEPEGPAPESGPPSAGGAAAETDTELRDSVRMLKSMITSAVEDVFRRRDAVPETQIMPSAPPMPSASPMSGGGGGVVGAEQETAQMAQRDKMPDFTNAYQFGKHVNTPVIDFVSMPRLSNYIVKELNLSNLSADDIERVQELGSLIRDCVAMGDINTAESYFFDMNFILLPRRSLDGMNLKLLSTSKTVTVIKNEDEEEQHEKPKKLFR